MKALVTGATSGIGKKIAENLHNRGWELILTGRNVKALEEMQERLGKCEIIAADLSEKSEVLNYLFSFSRVSQIPAIYIAPRALS
jgi:short-subunit dehydrogenase